MTGREEINEKKERQIESMIRFMPDYMESFNKSMIDLLPSAKITYVNSVKKWLEYLRDEKEMDIENIFIFDEIRPSEINCYLMDLKASQSARNRSYYAIKKFYGFLVDDGYLDHNPMAKLKSPKAPKQKDAIALTQEEIKMLFHNIEHPDETPLDEDEGERVMENRFKTIKRNKLLVTLALTNGLRSSSLLEINVDDIDFDAKSITVVQKGDKYKKIWLTDDMIDMINEWLEDREELLENVLFPTDALFCTVLGNRMDNTNFNIMLKWASYNIDKPITAHKLRSTCATTIYKQTHDIYLASKILGHANVKTTQRYIEPDEQKEQDAVSLMSSYIL